MSVLDENGNVVRKYGKVLFQNVSTPHATANIQNLFSGREQNDIQKRKEWYRNWWFSIAKNYFGDAFNSVFALFGVTEFDFDNATFATDRGKYKIYKIKFSNTKKCKNGIKSAAKIIFRDRKSPISISSCSLLYIILFPTLKLLTQHFNTVI